jgi:hypothetical protein
MVPRFSFLYFIITTGLFSCSNNNSSTTATHDHDFQKFIEHFSGDSIFQASRTQFPLKVKQYQVTHDKDTIIYVDRAHLPKMDFGTGKKNSDRWSQRIIVNETNSQAIIEVRGIENGIMAKYHFRRLNGKWILILIEDSST